MFIRRRTTFALALIVGVVSTLDAHDLFLKPENFFVAPNKSVRVDVLNGTFTTSEGAVVRDRLRDLAVAGPNGVDHPSTESWIAADKTSRWQLPVGKSGTYVLGASLLPRALKLDAKEFNSYLEEDGLPEVLADRRAKGELDKPARERYSKHVKSLIQVGSSIGGQTDIVFGYPAELVPLTNPYSIKPGGILRVRAMLDGKRIPNQIVLSGGRNKSGAVIPEQSVRTDSAGVARIPLRASGTWYIKFISMRRIDPAAGDSVDFESKWATLTFAVR